MARKHTAFYNIGFSEAKALFRQKPARKWGHAIAREWEGKSYKAILHGKSGVIGF
jgi:hypothetical protein